MSRVALLVVSMVTERVCLRGSNLCESKACVFGSPVVVGLNAVREGYSITGLILGPGL